MQPISGVPERDLAVAWFTQRDKLTYLGIHGKGLSGASLELKVNSAANNVNLDEAEVRACLILHEWTPARPMAWEQKPVTGCDKEALGRYLTSTKSFVFDLSLLARKLATPATYGVSIEPVEEPRTNFQVVFRGGEAVIVKRSSGGEAPTFTPPEDSSENRFVGTSTSGSSGGEAQAPPLDTGFDPGPNIPGPGRGRIDASDQSTVSAPVDASEPTLAAAEEEPVTFAWVYAALVAVAFFPLVTRVLAYSLPRGTKRRTRR